MSMAYCDKHNALVTGLIYIKLTSSLPVSDEPSPVVSMKSSSGDRGVGARLGFVRSGVSTTCVGGRVGAPGHTGLGISKFGVTKKIASGAAARSATSGGWGRVEEGVSPTITPLASTCISEFPERFSLVGGTFGCSTSPAWLGGVLS